MLIDIHTHILPGIDDGAADDKMAFEMLQRAYEEGTRVLIATPHYHHGCKALWEDKRQSAWETVRSMAAEIGPDLQILLGAELFFESGILEDLRDGKKLTLNNTRSVLIEFSVDTSYVYIKNAILNLQGMGYIPILAHVERYSALARMERVKELVDMGVKIQANSDSVIGKNGWRIKRYLMKLMQEELIDLIASDAHDLSRRPPGMDTCIKYLSRKLEAEYSRMIFEDNAKILLNIHN